jgi:hypothetical protein
MKFPMTMPVLHSLSFPLISLTMWSWEPLERPQVVQPLSSFPAFYGTWRFIAAFTRASLFPSGFPIDVLLPHSQHMLRPPHPPQLNNSNYTWQRVQIMQLLVMQFSPPSHHFIPLWSKYSPQHPVLKHP